MNYFLVNPTTDPVSYAVDLTEDDTPIMDGDVTKAHKFTTHEDAGLMRDFILKQKGIVVAVRPEKPEEDVDTFWGRCSHREWKDRHPQFGLPHWREDDTCSHCGGLRPSLALKAIREGCEVDPTDKNYKIYIHMPDPKAGEMRVVSAITFDPDSNEKGWVAADPEILKRDGWGTDSEHKWMLLSPRPALKSVKCYLNHFSESQAIEFITLYEENKINLAYPGHFYRGMCFGIYKDAISKLFPPKPKAEPTENPS